MPVAIPQEIKDQARDLYLAERPTAEILKTLQVSRATFDTWVARGKWQTIKQLANQKVNKSLASMDSMNLQQHSERVKLRVATQLNRQLSALEGSRCETIDDLMNTPAGEGFSSVLKKTVETAAQVYNWGDEKASGLILVTDVRSMEVKDNIQEAQLVVSDAPEAIEQPQPVDVPVTTETTIDVNASESGS